MSLFINNEKYQEKCHLFADFSDFLGILGVSSDNLGTLSIGTRLLPGILVPDSPREVGGRWVKVGGSRESMLDDLVTWLIQVHHVFFFRNSASRGVATLKMDSSLG